MNLQLLFPVTDQLIVFLFSLMFSCSFEVVHQSEHPQISESEGYMQIDTLQNWGNQNNDASSSTIK